MPSISTSSTPDESPATRSQRGVAPTCCAHAVRDEVMRASGLAGASGTRKNLMDHPPDAWYCPRSRRLQGPL